MTRKSLMVRGLALGLVFTVAACGGSSDDDGSGGAGGSGGTSGSGGSGGGNAQLDPDCRVSNCPNEMQPYEDPDVCAAFKSDVCFPDYKALHECYLDNEVCMADGKKDRASVETCDDLKKTASDCTAAHL